MTDHRSVVLGAGSGLGRAIASELVWQGASVVCADSDVDSARDAAGSLASGAHSRVVASGVDVTDPAAVARLFAELDNWFGGVDVVINAAGIAGPAGALSHEVELDDFERVCAVNLTGAFLVSKYAIPGMVAQRYGRILHIASISGKDGNAGMVAYSASKAGLIGLVKAQGKEYAGTGVLINALAPALIETPMVAGFPQSQVDALLAKIPMGRFGTLSEVAQMAAFITSPACSFSTGFTFDLSGGRAVY